jgi:3-oxoacyl-[acyl-carrier protein] reductase
VRNVVVTGGSRGLGLEMARVLANDGYRVIAVARSESDALRAARGIAADAARGAIEYRACDLAKLGELAGFARTLRRDFGPIYGLVNNAGLGTAAVLGTMRDGDIERLVTLNTLAPILLTKYLVRSMMAAREGRIVNIASIVATTGYSGLSVYSATKASMLGFTRSLARELGSLGITVNAVAPGFISTDMTEELSETHRDQIARRSALKRMAEAVDVARAVGFLLGDGGRNLTGTTITVDAGNTA